MKNNGRNCQDIYQTEMTKMPFPPMWQMTTTNHILFSLALLHAWLLFLSPPLPNLTYYLFPNSPNPQNPRKSPKPISQSFKKMQKAIPFSSTTLTSAKYHLSANRAKSQKPLTCSPKWDSETSELSPKSTASFSRAASTSGTFPRVGKSTPGSSRAASSSRETSTSRQSS